jgi:hypothetical protein
MNWWRIAAAAVAVALVGLSGVAGELPGDPGYVVLDAYVDPLRPSAEQPGPCGAETLEDCIACCTGRSARDCLDWVQSIYDVLDGRSAFEEGEKLRGVWLPTIDAVRAAAQRIPRLKSVGINAVSFGPDVVTRDVAVPRTVGDRAIRFYVRLFHTAGFIVYLVPNSMHWGNNDVSLHALTPLVLDWAKEAERLGVELYAVLNEVDGMRDDVASTSAWLQTVLPQVRERYGGLLGVQPTQAGFKSGQLDVSGYDVVSPFFSLMVPEPLRNDREIDAFLSETERVRGRTASVRRVLLSDVATFSGGNWAETFLMVSQARALAEGRTEYSEDAEQAAAYETFLAEAYPAIDGCFFNLWIGFDFLSRPAESVVRAHFAPAGTLPEHPFDAIWGTPGLLDLIENAMLTDEEHASIFDLSTYVAGWAGLCHEPTAEQPGPFGCTSVPACMERFRRDPETYWRLAGEGCEEEY